MRHPLLPFALVGLWLLLLLTGWVPALVSHLFLAAGLILFPWRWLRDDPDGAGGGS